MSDIPTVEPVDIPSVSSKIVSMTWCVHKRCYESGLRKRTDVFQSLRRNCLTKNNRHPTQGNRIPEEEQRQRFIQYTNSHWRDFAHDSKFVRYSSILHGMFTRGRHNAISVILSTQKYTVLAPIIRPNASALFVFRFKNMNENNAFLEENSALVNKQQLYEMHQLAINDAPYSFLYINTNAKGANNMVYIRFDQVLRTDEDDC